MNENEQVAIDSEAPADSRQDGRLAKQKAQELLHALYACKSDARNDLARRYAIAITEAEKLYAWIDTWL